MTFKDHSSGAINCIRDEIIEACVVNHGPAAAVVGLPEIAGWKTEGKGASTQTSVFGIGGRMEGA